MSSLLAGIGQSLRGAMGGGVFPAATLHVATETLNEYGTPTRTFVDHVGTGFAANWRAEVMAAKGYTADTAKVVIVQGATLPKPKVGDEVTAIRPLTNEAERFRVTDVTSDPADATWQVAGVKV